MDEASSCVLYVLATDLSRNSGAFFQCSCSIETCLILRDIVVVRMLHLEGGKVFSCIHFFGAARGMYIVPRKRQLESGKTVSVKSRPAACGLSAPLPSL